MRLNAALREFHEYRKPLERAITIIPVTPRGSVPSALSPKLLFTSLFFLAAVSLIGSGNTLLLAGGYAGVGVITFFWVKIETSQSRIYESYLKRLCSDGETAAARVVRKEIYGSSPKEQIHVITIRYKPSGSDEHLLGAARITASQYLRVELHKQTALRFLKDQPETAAFEHDIHLYRTAQQSRFKQH